MAVQNEFARRHWELINQFLGLQDPVSFKSDIKSPGMPEGVTMRVRQ